MKQNSLVAGRRFQSRFSKPTVALEADIGLELLVLRAFVRWCARRHGGRFSCENILGEMFRRRAQVKSRRGLLTVDTPLRIETSAPAVLPAWYESGSTVARREPTKRAPGLRSKYQALAAS